MKRRSPPRSLKSAVLLAGLAAPGETTVIEQEATRDHTERMLKHFGASVRVSSLGDHGRKITLQGQPELELRADSGAGRSIVRWLPLIAALIVPSSELILKA
jgi:3-phosphoshikimate 1-carboxyvinyltransferase